MSRSEGVVLKTSSDLRKEEIGALVARYAQAAAAHGRATEAGDAKSANEAYEAVAGLYGELRRRGQAAQRALLPLLTNADLGVRAWVGAHALEFAATEAEPVLTAMSEIPKSLVSFSAKMTLREWREGKLRFP
jgi:hypothetical protein